MKCSYVERCQRPEDCDLDGFDIGQGSFPDDDRPRTCGAALAMIRELEDERETEP